MDRYMYQFQPIDVPESMQQHSPYTIRIYKIIHAHKIVGWLTNQHGRYMRDGNHTENHWRIFCHNHGQLQPWDIEDIRPVEQAMEHIQTIPLEKFLPPSMVYIAVITEYGQNLYANSGEYGELDMSKTPHMWDEDIAMNCDLQKKLNGYKYMTLSGDRVAMAIVYRMDGTAIRNEIIKHD